MNLAFVTITVNHMQPSFEFYTNIIGLKEMRRFSPREGTQIVFLKSESEGVVELIEHTGAHKQENTDSSNVSLGFAVESIEALKIKLQENGISIHREMKTGNGETLVFISDPDGVGITFIEGFKK